MLQGMMMDRPLLVSSILEYVADIHRDTEIVSHTIEGGVHRYNYADMGARVRQLAHALLDLGVRPGDRVATLAWNGYRHLELYYAVSGIGAVCHTINPRLFPEQLVYIINHADDRLIFTDLTFVPLLEALQANLPSGLRYAVMTDRAHMPETRLPDPLCYEELLAGRPTGFDWPEFDENAAMGLCYTSGTTGNPKGVLYSHRSTLLHSFMVLAANVADFSQGSVVLPIVPLFHAHAWALPFTAPLRGVKLVFPGMAMSGPALFAMMDAEKVNSTWGVPTIWLMLIEEMRKQGRAPDGLRWGLIGGSAAPFALVEELEDRFGVEMIHGWGMTEMSPVGTVTMLPPRVAALSPAERREYKRSPGRRVFGVDLRIVDDAGQPLPHDGKAFGELVVRGATVVSGYFNNDAATADAIDDEGWFRTGDVARIDPEGFLTLVDRSKDVIKSGGEWISSIDMEDAAMAHPAVQECAVIAVPHAKWGERPLLIVVRREGATASAEELRDFLAGKVARWWLPEEVVFADSLPHTPTGKVSKLQLRQRYAGEAAAPAGE